MIPTRKDFIDTYRKMVVATYPWAGNAKKLAKFMLAVEDTIAGRHTGYWSWDGDLGIKTWRIIHGGRPSGRYTLKALRALPEA